MKYCAVNLIDGVFKIGDTKKEVVNQIYEKWEVDLNRTLSVKMKGYKEYIHHSYSSEYSEEEMEKDIINFLFNQLENYRCRMLLL